MNLEVVPTGAGSVNALESEGVRPRSQIGVRNAGRIHVFRAAFLDADSMQLAWVSWYLVTTSDAATPHSGRTRRAGNMGGKGSCAHLEHFTWQHQEGRGAQTWARCVKRVSHHTHHIRDEYDSFHFSHERDMCMVPPSRQNETLSCAQRGRDTGQFSTHS